MGVYFRQQYAVGVAGVSGGQAWVPLDIHQNPFAVSFFINRAAGGGDSTCRVEHTFKNILVSSDVTALEVFRHEDASAVAVSSDGNYAFPVRALRLNVVQGSGSTTYDFAVIQGDGK